MIAFKVKLEQALEKASGANLITILIEGGLTALIEAGTRVKNNIPVIVMNGTGRASDLIGTAFDILRDGKFGDLHSQPFKEKLKKLFNDSFASSRDWDINNKKGFEAMLTVLGNIHKVTIWDMKCEEGTIDITAILLRLINSLSGTVQLKQSSSPEPIRTYTQSRDSSEVKQLSLAIKWNRWDLTDYLFKGMRFTPLQLNELLAVALKHKQAKFVTAILNEGTDLKQFLTEKRFEEYLNDADLTCTTPLESLLNKQLSKTAHLKQEKRKMKRPNDDEDDVSDFNYEHFIKVIHDISQGVYEAPTKLVNTTKQKADNVTKKGEFLQKLFGCGTGYYHRKKKARDNLKECDKSPPDFQDPAHVLVLYLVLTMKHELAMGFWEHSRTPLMLSLVCANICKWLIGHEFAIKEITGEDKDKLELYKLDWEKLAYRMVNETYVHYDAKWVNSLINHPFSSWGGRSSLEIAGFTHCKSFIAHIGVSKFVTDEWMGELDPDTSYQKIITAIFITPIFMNSTYFKQIKAPAIHDHFKISKKALEKRDRQEFINCKDREDELDDMHNDSETSFKKISREFFCKFIMFHRAPVTKYFVSLIFHLAFLAIFCYALVTNKEFDRSKVLIAAYRYDFSYIEWGIVIYVLSTIPLEIRQMNRRLPSTVPGKIRDYFYGDYFNIIDASILVVLLVACITKKGYFMWSDGAEYETFNVLAYKVLMGICFSLSTLRLLQYLQINSITGPKVSMITNMVRDVLFFMSIMGMAILAYGVATEGIIHPLGKDHSEIEIPLQIWSIIWRPYIHLFGELDLDTLNDQLDEGYCILDVRIRMFTNETEMKDEISRCMDPEERAYSCSENLSCKYGRAIVQLWLAVFMMVGSVLMLNLLIAVFAKTYDKMTKDDQDKILWKWQRYELLMEFSDRSAFPFPIFVIPSLLTGLRWIWRRCCPCGSKSHLKTRNAQKKIDNEKTAQMSVLERDCLRNIIKQNIAEAKLQSDQSTVKSARAQAGGLITDINVPLIPEVDDGPSLDMDVGEVLDPRVVESAIDVGEALFPSINVACGLFSSLLHSPPNSESSKSSGRPLTGKYPGSEMTRFPLTLEQRPWTIELTNYEPVAINTNIKVGMNEKDEILVGEGEVERGYPRNPLGRTGVIGRGNCLSYGPNYVSVPIITRFAASSQMDRLDALLEVLVAITPSGNISLPELDGRNNEPLTKDFVRFLFDAIPATDHKSRKHLKQVLRSGVLLKKGVVESVGATDNAWTEAFIVSYHDDENHALPNVNPQLKQEDKQYTWNKVRKNMFSGRVYSKYFERAVFSRQVSQFVGIG